MTASPMQPYSAWTLLKTAQSRQAQEIAFWSNLSADSAPLNTLFLAVFHGDEPESWVLIDALMRTVSFEVPVGIVPMVNPDGFHAHQRVNAAGVDLNRNFPTTDWAERDIGSAYYSGPAAASEPETQFILDILTAYSPQKIVSIHTPYKVINYDGPAKALADAMAHCNGYPVVEEIGYATPRLFWDLRGQRTSYSDHHPGAS